MSRSTDEVARSIVEQRVAPAAAAACARREAGRWLIEAGGATNTYFDLASVTKPMTAVAAVAAGIEEQTELGSILEEARGTASEHATIGQLLSHRAGLDGHRPLYAPLLQGERVSVAEALGVAADARRNDLPHTPPRGDSPPLYSDLGYLLVGAALARTSGHIDAGGAIEHFVVEPLALDAGTARALTARGIDIRDRAAPTEDVSWRGGLVKGEVHDENAWAVAGTGGCGHAGIFGTVHAVVEFGCALLDALDGLRAPWGELDLSWLVRERSGGTLRAGFDGKSPEGSSAGRLFGPRAFGHLGFTGTSLWLDPDAKVVAVLLTNRVCPSRSNMRIREARPSAHEALFARALTLTG